MAAVYANLIIKGIKQIEQVPEVIRKEVKSILVERGYPELVGGENAV